MEKYKLKAKNSEKIERLASLVRRLFTVMSAKEYDEPERSRRMDIIRFKIERFSDRDLLQAVGVERAGKNKFVYNLFLDQIKFARKV